MAGKRKQIVDIYALLQHLRAGASNRGIKRDLGVDRRTAKKYREWAEEYGLLKGTLPPIEELFQLLEETMPTQHPPQSQSTVEPYRKLVVKLREQDTEVSAIKQRLEERGFRGSYMAVWRFVKQLEPAQADVTVRVETAPGEEAQVDFGYTGKMIDPATGEIRKTWAFVLTLSWSRHQYVEFVFNQQIPTWLRLHRNAFAFLGGVPQRVVIDNLKAGITQACWDDPEVQVTYRECAEHYGFLIAPCKPQTPQHKGKVEKGGVHYVKRNFLGGREMTTITQANQDVKVWCLTTAGQRRHGTTRNSPWCSLRPWRKRRCSPFRKRPMTWPCGNRPNCTGIATWFLTMPTTLPLSAWWGRDYGFAAAVKKYDCIPLTTSWWRLMNGPPKPVSASPIRPICRPTNCQAWY